jgi:hypothetical protein
MKENGAIQSAIRRPRFEAVRKAILAEASYRLPRAFQDEPHFAGARNGKGRWLYQDPKTDDRIERNFV